MFLIALRMSIVLALLLGLPLVAIPQISERMAKLLFAPRRESIIADSQPSSTLTDRGAKQNAPLPQGTTVTMLADDRPPSPQNQSNPEGLAATIEALKAEFVAAGVTYMVLERVDTGSPRYRFRFDLPVAAGSAYRKRFQVVDDAADEAMRKALTQLRQWRVAANEPAHLERPTVMLR